MLLVFFDPTTKEGKMHNLYITAAQRPQSRFISPPYPWANCFFCYIKEEQKQLTYQRVSR